MLISHWPLDGHTKDVVGGLDGSGSPTYTDGKLGQGIVGDGSSINVSLDPALKDVFSGNEMSLSLWWNQYSHTDGDDWRDVFEFDNVRLERGNANASNNAEFWCNIGSPGGDQIYEDTSVPSGEWFHIAIVRRPDALEGWVNGSKVTWDNYSGGAMPTIGSDITINGQSSGSDLDDIRIYNHALSTHEIKELARAKVGHWTFDGIGEVETFEDQRTKPGWSMPNAYIQTASKIGDYSIGSQNNGSIDMTWRPPQLEGGRQIQSFSYWWREGSAQSGHQVRLYDSDGNKVQQSETENPQWQMSDGGGGMNDVYSDYPNYNVWTLFQMEFDWSAGTYNYRCYSSDGISTVTGSYDLIRSTDVERIDFVGTNGTKCRFDGISYALPGVTDQSGQGNHGFVEGAHAGHGPAIGSTCAKFHGDGGQIRVPDSPSLDVQGDGITISLWKYMIDKGDEFHDMLRKDASGTGYRVSQGWGTDNYSGVGSFGFSNDYSAPFTQEVMEHVVLRLKDGSIETWVNGQLENQDSYSGSIGTNNNDLKIGPGWWGRIDDVRIYAKGLSDQAIQDLYQTRARMDEQSRFFAQSFEEARERVVAADQTFWASYNQYNVIGGFNVQETDFSAWVEPDDKLGSIFLEGWVHLTDPTYYPTTFEMTKENNDKGFYMKFSQAKRSPSSWTEGWQYVKVPVDGWDSASSTPWENLDRVQLYAANIGSESSADSSQTIRFKDLKLRKYPGHSTEPGLATTGTCRTSQVSEVGPAANSLVGWWDFSRHQALDKVGLHDGTLNGNASVVGDQFGGSALQCDASGDYVDIGTVGPELEFGTGGFTISALVTPDSTGNHRTILELSKYSHGILLRPSYNELDIYINGSSWKPSVGFSGGQTYHLVVTRTNGTVEAYKDGVSQGTNTLSGSVDINQQTYIGTSVHNTDQSYNGKIHDLRLYDRSLSSEEVSLLRETLLDQKMKQTPEGIYAPELSSTF